MLFNIYINELLVNISKSNCGCKLGYSAANVIGYADDIVLLAPSVQGLQRLITLAAFECSKIKLQFNCNKSKIKHFKNKHKDKEASKLKLILNGSVIESTTLIKYLGYMIHSNLSNSEDLNKCKRNFLIQLNSLIRKFPKTDPVTFLYLFKSYCFSFYGCELWFSNKWCKLQYDQLKVAYHNGVKRIRNLRYWQSSHMACEDAGVLTFSHLVNLRQYNFIWRMINKPNFYTSLIKPHLLFQSTQVLEVETCFSTIYDVPYLWDNDKEAIKARIFFVDRHEPRSQYVRILTNV